MSQTLWVEEEEDNQIVQGNQTYMPFATFQSETQEDIQEDEIPRLIRAMQRKADGSSLKPQEIQNTKDALRQFLHEMQTSLFSFLDRPILPQVRAEGLTELVQKLELTGTIQERVQRTESTEAKEWLQEKLASCEGAGLVLFQNQMNLYLASWREVSQELMQAEKALHEQMELYKKFRARTLEILLLPENEEKEAVVTAFQKYLEAELKTFRIEALFHTCLKAYSKLSVLQQGIASIRVFQTQSQVPTCGVCFGEEVSRCLIPCGHTFCQDCADQTRHQCFVCRTPIRRTQKIFFS